ncbi:MAG: hypothetical protein QOK16_3246 [Solirubrobacteraceae bacterium]|nr:hypothetical protein [Solirubrobacteraceae bacterium]MEA2188235.1 hypothetical protein [Solirubrobacteraceae bacterium]
MSVAHAHRTRGKDPPIAHEARRRGVLAIILTGYLLILIDVSILMAALPRIHHDLQFSTTGLSWVQNAYTLAFGGLLLLGARAGDLLGRRRMFIAGIALFTAASLAVGLAQSPAWMITARAVQGVGAAMLAPATLALLSTAFPEGSQRTRAMAAYGALAGVATGIGLIVGGVLTETLSWRFGFFLNVPVGVAAVLAAPRYLDETARQPGRLELRGALTSTLGVSALVYGIVRSADTGWTDPATTAAIAAGVALVALFFAGQKRAPRPLLPLRLFASRQRAGA